MITQEFKLAYKAFLKNKINSFLCLLGLVIGIVTCVVILNYNNYHKSFDQHFKNVENVYRVSTEVKEKNGESKKFAKNYSAIGKDLVDFFPGVTASTYSYYEEILVFNDDKKFLKEDALWVHESFIDFFGLELLDGVPTDCLSQPGTGLISESAARKFFGGKNPVGEILKYDGNFTFEVKGVFKEIPKNSHFHADYLITFAPYAEEFGKQNYGFLWYYTYVKVNPNTPIASIENEIGAFSEQYLPLSIKNKQETAFQFQPVSDIHLKSKLLSEIEQNYSNSTIRLLALLAIMIILVSYINYSNIYINQSLLTLKEVGIKKVLGANLWNVFTKNFTFTLSINLLAVLLAVLFLFTQKSEIGNYFENNYFMDDVFSQRNISLYILFILVGSLVPGIYVSVLLFLNNTISSLKFKLSSKSGARNLKFILLTFQFVVTILMITVSLSINKQIKFMQERDLGFTLDNVLAVDAPRTLFLQWDALNSKYKSFKDRIEQIPGVEGISWSNSIPGREPTAVEFVCRQKELPPEANKSFKNEFLDNKYFSVYDIEFLAGENIKEGESWWTRKVILNKSAVKELGFASVQDAVGKYVTRTGDGFDHTKLMDYEVVGVIDDYHVLGLQNKILPMIFFPATPVLGSFFSIKLNAYDKATLKEIKTLFTEVYPNDVYNPVFMTDFFNKQYKEEILFRKLIFVISIIIIFLSCLGIFALVNENIQRKTKEIGIRKVNGASILNIFINLNKNIIYLLVLSAVLSIPLSYYYIKQWLENFEYNISLGILTFLLPIILILLIVVLTISSRVYVISRINPIRVLREE